MRCERAIIEFRDGKPFSYSLVIAGLEKPDNKRGAAVKETTFKEAYTAFPAIRKHWNADGTAKQ